MEETDIYKGGTAIFNILNITNSDNKDYIFSEGDKVLCAIKESLNCQDYVYAKEATINIGEKNCNVTFSAEETYEYIDTAKQNYYMQFDLINKDGQFPFLFVKVNVAGIAIRRKEGE